MVDLNIIEAPLPLEKFVTFRFLPAEFNASPAAPTSPAPKL